jgi:molybdopterin/thiamine biosynthesis adenylyltransferase
LAGPKKVDIYDPIKVHIRDLSANFYINESSVHRHRRDVASIKRLAGLNSHVRVKILGEEGSDDESEDGSAGSGDADDLSEDESTPSSQTEESNGESNGESIEESNGESKEESKEESSGQTSSQDSDDDGSEYSGGDESGEDDASVDESESEAGEDNASVDEAHESLPKDLKLDKNIIRKYDVVVVTELIPGFDNVEEVNEMCRELNKGFIFSLSLGAYGFCFVDFGKNFICRDKTGEEHKSFNVVGISKNKKAEVTVHKSKGHSYGDGDNVTFREVKGMEELNKIDKPIKIKVIDMYTIQLDLDTTKFATYKRDGVITSQSVSQKINHFSLKECGLNPLKSEPGYFNTIDLANFGRSEQLHIGLTGLMKFYGDHKRLPKNKKKEVHEVLKTVHKYNDEMAKKDKNYFNVDVVQDAVIKLMTKFSRNQIAPMTSFFGGIVCQEIVKYTGKFAPLEGKFTLIIL